MIFFFLKWCFAHVQSACKPYCILQSKAIASHLQEACQNPLFCIVSESGNVNMYCSLSNLPKCYYVFCGVVRLCLYLPQPSAWELWKKKGKRIMGKRSRSKVFPIGNASICIRAAWFQSWSPSSAITYSQTPGKADSDWTGCNHLVKPFWKEGEGRRKVERKKRW